jgi:hypothetical protein
MTEPMHSSRRDQQRVATLAKAQLSEESRLFAAVEV